MCRASNCRINRVVGYPVEEVVGRPLMHFIPETERPIVAQSLHTQFFETGEGAQIASTARARDGTILSVLVNASKATFEGRPASIAVIVDVTERNAAQRKLASTTAILAAEHEINARWDLGCRSNSSGHLDQSTLRSDFRHSG